MTKATVTADACRSCGARIVWTATPAGKGNPVDVAAVPDGNVLVLAPRGLPRPLAVTLSGESLTLARANGVELRVSHWATCPDRQQWRDRTDAAAAAAEASA